MYGDVDVECFCPACGQQTGRRELSWDLGYCDDCNEGQGQRDDEDEGQRDDEDEGRYDSAGYGDDEGDDDEGYGYYPSDDGD